jgi:WD40 repeat protein
MRSKQSWLLRIFVIAGLILFFSNGAYGGKNSPPEVKCRRGHLRGASVGSVAFSPDGKYLASGCSDQSAILWDLSTGRVLHKFPGEESVDAVAFGPEGRLLATAGHDEQVTLWDASTGRKISELSGHEGIIWSLSFSPDGKLVASGGNDETVKLWEVETGRLKATLSGHEGSVTGVEFLGNGKLIASGSVDGTVRIWDVSTGETRRELSPDFEVESVSVSPDGQLLAVGGGSFSRPATTVVWNLKTGEKIHTRSGPEGVIRFVAFGPEGKRLASGGDQGKVVVEGPRTGKVISTIRMGKRVHSGAFSPDGKLLATGNRDGLVQLWNPETGKEAHPLAPRKQRVYGMAFGRERELLSFCGAGVKRARLWDLSEGRKVQPPWNIDGTVTFSPGRRYVALDSTRTVKFWDRQTGRKVGELSVDSDEYILGVAFSPDGTQLCTVGGSKGGWPPGPGVARLWEVPGGRQLKKLSQTKLSMKEVFFAPDGKRIVTGPWFPGKVRVCDVSSGETLQSFRGERGLIVSISLSADGSLLAGALSEGKVKLWDLKTGELRRTLSGHDEGACVAFAPDGKVLATGGKEGQVKLWEFSSGEVLRSFRLEKGSVDSIAFSADGRFMAVEGAGLVHLYDPGTCDRLLTILPLPEGPDKYIAWTPEGYYMGSREGEIVLSVKVRENYVPISEYRQQLKRPEAVARKLAGEEVPVPDLDPKE